MREYLKLAKPNVTSHDLRGMLLLAIVSFLPLLKAVTIGLYLLAYLLWGPDSWMP